MAAFAPRSGKSRRFLPTGGPGRRRGSGFWFSATMAGASVPFPEPFRVLLNNYDGLENREGRLWLRTYQVVVLACGTGEQEEL